MADDTPKQVYAKSSAGFVPVSDPARAFFDRVKIGGLVELEGRQPRNLNHHRLFWALMAWAAENCDGYETAEQVCHTVKVLMGHCDFVPDGKGGLVAVPKSISFAALDEIAFSDFHRKAMDAVLRLLPAGCSQATIMEALQYA
jgi:hypothetical protein